MNYLNNSDTSLNMNKDGPLLMDCSNELLKLQIEHLRVQILQNMGLPPHRPNKGYRFKVSDRDAFFMDFENACLRDNWDNSIPFPTGPKRFENSEWAKMIQSQVYPHHSDIDWYEYVEYCQLGLGDEWFQEEEQ